MRIVACLLGLGALLFIIGCGERETLSDKAFQEKVFLLNNGAEPRDLDHHVVTGMPENRVIKALVEGLAAEHPTESSQVVPGMAERWESDDSKKVWTFYLREAVWSNGDPVTAHDFVYAYERLLNPELGASYAGMLYVIEGATAFNEGEVEDFDTVGVQAIDDRTLEITLSGPTPHFPLMLTHYTWFPVHQGTIEKFDAFARRGSGWTQPGNHVGNGPFILEEWLPNQIIKVRKNPTYWDASSVELEGIHFFPVSDRQTENRMFQTGQLHKTNGLPFNLRDLYRERNDPALREDKMFATGYLGLNVREGALSDSRVRQALSLTIDRKQIIQRVTKNGEAAQGFVPPHIPDYPFEGNLEYNPEKARALLAEAGYANGEGIPRLNFIIANTDTSKIFAEVVQSMWLQELGVELEINNKEWQVLISEMDSGNFDIFMLSWIGDYMEPATFLKIMRADDGNNRTGFAEPAYDRLLDKANQAVNTEDRLMWLSEAEEILMRELPILPITWSRNMYLIDPRIKGWADKALMDQPYKSVSF